MRKNKLLLLLALLLTAATGAWAQTTINVTAGDLGKAVCTDGSIYDDVYKAKSAGKTAAAKIICLDTQNSKALALSLDNQAVTPGTVDYATAQSRCEALNTTLAVTFGTWVLPSKAQWEAMIEAAGSYQALRNGIGTLFGGTKMEAVVYWSSTAGTTGHWRFNFNDGDWDDDTDESSARACLVINLPKTYSVTLKDGVKDADKWTVKVGEGQAYALPIGGLKGEGSETVTLQYNGRLKVKGVKATSDEQEAVLKTPATVTTAPTGAAIVGVGKTTALVSGGAAEGGTLMYRVTTENTKPASTDGFSGDVPTAKDITASGKVYVWYYVKGDDTHSDSEIAATAIEVPVADVVWDAMNVTDLMRFGKGSYEKEGVTLSVNAAEIDAVWDGNGIRFNANESGGFTFTAPTGKAFTKIEMRANGPAGWDSAAYVFENLGSGWAYFGDDENMIYTVTWKDTAAASSVGLLTGADMFNGETAKYIAFYLSE